MPKRGAFGLVPALKQFIPTDHLAVARIPDLHPVRVAVLDRITAMPMFGHNALQVSLTGQLKQALAIGLDVVNVQEMDGAPRHDVSQRPLTFNQRQVAEIAAIKP